MIEFTRWPSISRFYRPVVLTEKIDGSNGAIHIENASQDYIAHLGTIGVPTHEGLALVYMPNENDFFVIGAQSRSRLITPADDNFGFATWVEANAVRLCEHLGPGIHFGEWWGHGINRGYGLKKGDRRFSLFNTKRWNHLDGTQVPGLHCVPIIGVADPSEWDAKAAGDILQQFGSLAAPGYRKPEGVVIYHQAGDVLFKYSFNGDGHKAIQPGKRTRHRPSHEEKRKADPALVAARRIQEQYVPNPLPGLRAEDFDWETTQ